MAEAENVSIILEKMVCRRAWGFGVVKISGLFV
jgi:hypothetical protein